MDTQKGYWDKKIKEWTLASYENKTKSPIERLANLFRHGITKRLEVALDTVGTKSKDKVVLDLGCGLGDFCFALLKYKPKKVIGFDISEVAVKEAQRRAKVRKLGNKVEFIQGNAAQVKSLPQADLTIGLGFIDYLNHEDLEKLFRLLSGRYFLFSFFEKKFSLLNLLHEVYIRIQKCPGAYKYTRAEVQKLIPENSKAYFLERDKMLFITNLPK